MTLQEQFGTWYNPLKEFIESPYFKKSIPSQINNDRIHNIVIPEKGSELFFKVFRVTDYNSLKVVVIGQDPYSNPVEAYDGLAFSNSTLFHPQPSLRNILKEVEDDIYDGFNIERIGNLSLYEWAAQGVLLLNTALSVRQGHPESHLEIWRPFTEFVIRELQIKNDIVWLLWGNKAQSYSKLITNPSHAIINSGHPSPLNTANPFKGCKCFSKCNEQLRIRNLKEIIW